MSPALQNCRRRVRFTVTCRSTRPGDQMRIVGSSADLGSWSPRASTAVLNTSADEFPIWRSGWLDLPAVTEYKYVIMNGHACQWERGENRKLPSQAHCASGMELRGSLVTDCFDVPTESHVAWEEGSLTPVANEESKASKGFIACAFSLHCETAPGEEVRAVGSPPFMGAWSPSASQVTLSTSDGTYPLWTSKAFPISPSNLGFEFKYVIYRNGTVVRWEKCGNRSLNIPEGTTDGQSYDVLASFGNDACVARLVSHRNQSERPENTGSLPCEPAEVDHVSRTNGPLVSVMTNPSSRSYPLLQSVVMAKHDVPARVPVTTNKSPSQHSLSTLGSDDVVSESKAVLVKRRRQTIACASDLPACVVPTRRSLLIGMQTDNTWTREAVCTVMSNTSQAGIVARNRRVSVKLRASLRSSASISHIASLPKIEPSEESAQSESDAGTDLSTVHSNVDEDSETPVHEDSKSLSFDMTYELHEQLGEGAFGLVYRCSARDSETEDSYAAKVIQLTDMNELESRMLFGDETIGEEGEVAIHKSIPSHPLIVGLLHCFVEPHAVTLVLDYCSGGDLFDVICSARSNSQEKGLQRAMNEMSSARVIWQVLSALAFCHAHDVVHRDVKAENVLFDSSLQNDLVLNDEIGPNVRARLCDFGMSARAKPDEQHLTQLCGSPDYVAPEIVKKQPYGQKVDVWAAGVLLFACLRGKTPFASGSDTQVIQNVIRGQIQFDSAWASFEPTAAHAVSSLMTLSPVQRPSSSEALAEVLIAQGAQELPQTGSA